MVVEVAAFLALVLAAGPAATDVNATVDTAADVREVRPLAPMSGIEGNRLTFTAGPLGVNHLILSGQ